jgi:hypothetical protein
LRAHSRCDLKIQWASGCMCANCALARYRKEASVQRTRPAILPKLLSEMQTPVRLLFSRLCVFCALAERSKTHSIKNLKLKTHHENVHENIIENTEYYGIITTRNCLCRDRGRIDLHRNWTKKWSKARFAVGWNVAFGCLDLHEMAQEIRLVSAEQPITPSRACPKGARPSSARCRWDACLSAAPHTTANLALLHFFVQLRCRSIRPRSLHRQFLVVIIP